MVSSVDSRTWRIIPSRYPAVGIFDDVADPNDLDAILALEAATNPRILDAAGDLRLVRAADRVSGPGSTPIMAAFTHVSDRTRFCDGSYGVYYAALDEETAIVETAYHRARFLRESRLPDEWLDMRVYTARVIGRYDDARPLSERSPLYHRSDYTYAQRYARRLHDADRVDGIVYRSVRREPGECIAAFRPRCIRTCRVAGHLQYRFSNYVLDSVLRIERRQP